MNFLATLLIFFASLAVSKTTNEVIFSLLKKKDIILALSNFKLGTICASVTLLNETSRNYDHVCTNCTLLDDSGLAAGWYAFGIGNVLPFECTVLGHCETSQTYWANYNGTNKFKKLF